MDALRRGAIINTKTNRLVCIPPVKSDLKETIETDDYSDWSFEPLVDGVMINMFYHEEEIGLFQHEVILVLRINGMERFHSTSYLRV